MIRQILILILFFYFLTLLQISFFSHLFRYSPNLVLISIILINLFVKDPQGYFGLSSALIGGFFLDIFSEKFFGYYILISLALYIFIKFFLKKYVSSPIFKKIQP